DVLGLRTLRPFLDFELDLHALVERLVPLGTDGGVVHEDVRTVLTGDETVSLAVVEPLDPSSGHDQNLLARTDAVHQSGRGDSGARDRTRRLGKPSESRLSRWRPSRPTRTTVGSLDAPAVIGKSARRHGPRLDGRGVPRQVAFRELGVVLERGS